LDYSFLSGQVRQALIEDVPCRTNNSTFDKEDKQGNGSGEKLSSINVEGKNAKNDKAKQKTECCLNTENGS